jgi:hypothetical protein
VGLGGYFLSEFLSEFPGAIDQRLAGGDKPRPYDR